MEGFDYSKVNNLKPGTYLMQGDNIKSLSLLDASGWGVLGGSNGDGLRNLSNTVSYLYASLFRIRLQVQQTPFKWVDKSGKELESAPYGLNAVELSRAVKAIYMYHNAYWHKARGRGGKSGQVVSLAWLDPGTILPDRSVPTDLHKKHHERYIRSAASHNLLIGEARQHVFPHELLKLEYPDMPELHNSDSPVNAVRASAAVTRAVNTLMDHMFDKNNGLPIFLVHVDNRVSTQSEEAKKLKNRLLSFFNRRSQSYGDNKVAILPGGVSVEKLSLTPSEMKLTEADENSARSIIAGLGLPMSKIFGAANYATKKGDNQEFALELAHMLKWVADVINEDDAFKNSGIRLLVEPEKVAMNLADEQLRVDMAVTLILSGETRQNAYKMAGIKLPEDYEEVKEPEPPAAQPQAVMAQAEQVVNETESLDPIEDEIRKAVAFARKGKRGREFKSDILTDEEIKLYQGHVYP